ncbi:MAG: ATP-binding protein [Alphaproteobacteria bacterium]|nr:ATP-binding protein [Alphaproteobacteria bacterium]
MLPTLPEKWVFGEKVPFQESSLVEFKEVSVFAGLFKNKSLGSSGLPKYRETIIGFLNGGNGYLIMGIKNNGTIMGVENIADDVMDKFMLWIDGNFNALVYKNGKPIDPSQITIKVHVFPVEGRASRIIVIEVENREKIMDIMTRSGTIIYRLNASNFKVSSEPVYRKRDVKGMIHAVQGRLQLVIDEKRKTIERLQDKHEDEIKEVLKSQSKEIRAYVEQISQSLYDKYKMEEEENTSLCSRILNLFVWYK